MKLRRKIWAREKYLGAYRCIINAQQRDSIKKDMPNATKGQIQKTEKNLLNLAPHRSLGSLEKESWESEWEVGTVNGDNFSKKFSWPGVRGLQMEGNVAFFNQRRKEPVKKKMVNS